MKPYPGHMRLLVLLLTALTAQAKYEEDYCNKYALDGEEITAQPFLLDDFSVSSEKVVKLDEDGDARQVSSERLLFSEELHQAVLFAESPTTMFWFHVDAKLDDCIYKEGGVKCVDDNSTCQTVANKKMFVTVDGGDVDVGTAVNSLLWPTNTKFIRRTADRGLSYSRNIFAKTYVTCTYINGETTVSVWRVLDPTRYKRLANTKPTLLSVIHRRMRDNTKVKAILIDYFDYKKLTVPQMANGLQIGEDQCGATGSKFMTKPRVSPSPRHRYLQELAVGDLVHTTTQKMSSFIIEYNYDSQLLHVTDVRPTDNQGEEDVYLVIIDFSTNHEYQYSTTNGSCKVNPRFTGDYGSRMQTPKAFWHFNEGEQAYLGVYYSRDIPCDVWRHDFPEAVPGFAAGESFTLYVATRDWLKSQGKPADAFYPVSSIRRKQSSTEYMNYYEFIDNPGYHIPKLPRCFAEEGLVTVEVTLLTRIQRTPRFEYEFRSAIKNITGIKSQLRIQDITPFERSPSSRETVVAFSLYGNMRNINPEFKARSHMQVVHSKDAADMIQQQVDKGSFKFFLGGKPITLPFKKGSFALASYDFSMSYVDGAGYSGGAMAAVAICLLLLGLALGGAGVFGYKRLRDGGTLPGLSIDLSKILQQSDA